MPRHLSRVGRRTFFVAIALMLALSVDTRTASPSTPSAAHRVHPPTTSLPVPSHSYTINGIKPVAVNQHGIWVFSIPPITHKP